MMLFIPVLLASIVHACGAFSSSSRPIRRTSINRNTVVVDDNNNAAAASSSSSSWAPLEASPSSSESSSPSQEEEEAEEAIILPNNAAYYGLVDREEESSSSVAATATRRNALSSALSITLAAASAVRLPQRAAAASSSSSPDEQQQQQQQRPYTVLLGVQLDSNEPNELSEIEIEVRPEWAPLAANRFEELVASGFYDDAPFFRVLPGFIAQFGVAADPALNKKWMYCDANAGEEEEVRRCEPALPDEPRVVPNKKGTVSFATSGRNTRRSQVFINLGDNSGVPNFLDGQGFVPFATVVRGMDVAKKLNGEYKGSVNQGKGAYYGGEYFSKVFPRLSIIRYAKVM